MIKTVEMEESLAKDNDFFKRAMDLIPPHFYFDRRDQYVSDNSMHNAENPDKGNQKRATDTQALKAKWKKAKYDPTQMKSVSQVQKEQAEEDEGEKTVKKKKKKADNFQLIGSGNPVDSLEELQEKLRIKVESLQAKRKKLGHTDAIERHRLKRRESKMKLKMKKKIEKHKNQKSIEKASPTPKTPKTPKPIFNKEGQIVFSKFDFLDKTGKSKSDKSSGHKQYKHLLEKVQSEKEKVEKLKVEDSNKAKIVKDKAAWKSALQKAEGVKVKDNPELLKKSIKRVDKIKKKHAKEWKEREEKVEKRKSDKQAKRTKNLQKRKQGRVDKKIKKSKKKGHIIPGF